MATDFQEFAPAKINLCLHVTGRRGDGFHELESLTVFADMGDRITAAQADGLELEISGPMGAGLSAEEDNLVLRAARALSAAAGIRAEARLHLEKHLPIAGGIGGGSADAAAALRALNRLWRLGLAPDELHEIAGGLGADVPACLISRPLIMRGIGERLEKLDGFPGLHLVLVNPHIAAATPQVFRALNWQKQRAAPPLPALPAALTPDKLTLWLRESGNDLERAAMQLAPQIGGVLDALGALPGCRLARMSGSGTTCFGLFTDAAAADAAAAELAHAKPQWWVRAVTTGS